MDGANTRTRVVDAALVAFGTRGYETTSLDALAAELGVRKQTILYYFPSKEALLDAAIDRGAGELSQALEGALASAGGGWDRVEAIVRSVFQLAGRRPELLGLLREVSRLGPPAATRLTAALDPLIGRATTFLQAEMEAGTMRAPGAPSPPAGRLLDGHRRGHRGRGPAGPRASSRPPGRWFAGGPSCWPSCAPPWWCPEPQRVRLVVLARELFGGV